MRVRLLSKAFIADTGDGVIRSSICTWAITDIGLRAFLGEEASACLGVLGRWGCIAQRR